MRVGGMETWAEPESKSQGSNRRETEEVGNHRVW